MKKKRNTKQNLKLLGRFLKGSRLLFAASVLFAIVTALCDTVNPQIIRMAIDNAVGGAEPSQPPFVLDLVEKLGGFAYLGKHLWIMALAVVAVAAVKALAQYLFRVSNTKAAETLVKTMRDSLFSHIERLPYAWHGKNRTGDIIQRCTSDIDTMKNFVAEQLTSVFRIVILLVLSILFMVRMDLSLTLIALAPMPLIIGYSLIFHRKIGKGFEECDENEGVLSAMVQENLTGVRVVRAFGRERYERDRFEAQNVKYTNLWVKLSAVMARYWSSADVLSSLQVLLVIAVGASYCIRGRLITGEYVAFITYNSMLVWPIRMLGRMISEMSKAGVSLDRIAYIMSAEEEAPSEKALTPPLDRDIVFDHVSFAYEDSPEMLHDISFTLPAGKTLGILGGTGSGKSTLMALLNKLYLLSDGGGSICIGGTDVKDIDTGYLRKNIGMVLQEPFLFSRSLQENISITRPDMTLEDVREVSRAACLDDTVMDFAKGYDTFVGERGVTLSGGQKQRAAIARTLAQNTPIMIFDDSLSAVDTETDAKIRRSLEERFGSASVILISHRITTLSKADRIIVLEKGRILQAGTHEELIRQEGVYRQIYEIQSGSGKEGAQDA
ncbi:MAG: ABC transporter ATP-binding protein [Lachnospiraceae bacterium]|jgi:ATP-binding cassette subfamily B protein|nr:ABC transporter ATP-binding protein [Lachnospiraceae bacterium]